MELSVFQKPSIAPTDRKKKGVSRETPFPGLTLIRQANIN